MLVPASWLKLHLTRSPKAAPFSPPNTNIAPESTSQTDEWWARAAGVISNRSCRQVPTVPSSAWYCQSSSKCLPRWTPPKRSIDRLASSHTAEWPCLAVVSVVSYPAGKPCALCCQYLEKDLPLLPVLPPLSHSSGTTMVQLSGRLTDKQLKVPCTADGVNVASWCVMLPLGQWPPNLGRVYV